MLAILELLGLVALLIAAGAVLCSCVEVVALPPPRRRKKRTRCPAKYAGGKR